MGSRSPMGRGHFVGCPAHWKLRGIVVYLTQIASVDGLFYRSTRHVACFRARNALFSWRWYCCPYWGEIPQNPFLVHYLLDCCSTLSFCWCPAKCCSNICDAFQNVHMGAVCLWGPFCRNSLNTPGVVCLSVCVCAWLCVSACICAARGRQNG